MNIKVVEKLSKTIVKLLFVSAVGAKISKNYPDKVI